MALSLQLPMMPLMEQLPLSRPLPVVRALPGMELTLQSRAQAVAVAVVAVAVAMTVAVAVVVVAVVVLTTLSRTNPMPPSPSGFLRKLLYPASLALVVPPATRPSYRHYQTQQAGEKCAPVLARACV